MSDDTSIERAKYEKAYATGAYQGVCHGMELLAWKDDLAGRRVIDLGCGSGALVHALLEDGIDAWGVDIASNSILPDLLPALRSRIFHECLWELPIDKMGAFDVAVCSDVMEHIPEAHVRQVLSQALLLAPICYFSINNTEEGWGHRVIGQPLHLTLRPMEWWHAEISAAYPTCSIETLSVPFEGRDDQIMFRVTRPAIEDYPVDKVSLSSLVYCWEHPDWEGEPWQEQLRFFTELEQILRVNPEHVADLYGKGSNLLRTFLSLRRVGQIYPLIAHRIPGRDELAVVPGCQRLCALRALHPTTDPLVRVRVAMPGEVVDDGTPVAQLYPAL